MSVSKDRRNFNAPGLNASSVVSGGTVNATVLKGDDNIRGIATIASGDSSVVVSAVTGVNSGFPIMVSLGNTVTASHRDLVVSVRSISDGVSFEAVVQNATVAGQEIAWMTVI